MLIEGSQCILYIFVAVSSCLLGGLGTRHGSPVLRWVGGKSFKLVFFALGFAQWVPSKTSKVRKLAAGDTRRSVPLTHTCW